MRANRHADKGVIAHHAPDGPSDPCHAALSADDTRHFPSDLDHPSQNDQVSCDHPCQGEVVVDVEVPAMHSVESLHVVKLPARAFACRGFGLSAGVRFAGWTSDETALSIPLDS